MDVTSIAFDKPIHELVKYYVTTKLYKTIRSGSHCELVTKQILQANKCRGTNVTVSGVLGSYRQVPRHISEMEITV